MKTYKAKDMLKVTGVSRDLYNQWVFKGVVKPHIQADGPGHHAEFSFGNLVSMKLMLKLRDMGIRLKPAQRIGEIVQAIMDDESEPEKLFLIINSENPNDIATLELNEVGNFYEESQWTITQTIRLDHLYNEVNEHLR